MELFFKMQFAKNVLVYVFGVFTFSFYYFFYEGFVHEVILVSLFLPFICISYPIKVFEFDTGILRDSCTVPLLKTLRRLPQSTAFLCLILFLMFACNSYLFCNNYLFRCYAIIICLFAIITCYWTSKEVLLNVVAPLDSAVPSFDFEQINVFLTSGFDFISIVFDLPSVSRSLPELYFSHSILVLLLLTLRESIYGSWR